MAHPIRQVPRKTVQRAPGSLHLRQEYAHARPATGEAFFFNADKAPG